MLHSKPFVKYVWSIALLSSITATTCSFSFAAPPKGTSPATPLIKNVIVLVSDGTSSTHTTLTRWYKGAPLTLDSMVVGGVRTYCANSIITDSAPAATAFATGYKSDSKFISVYPNVIELPATQTVSPEEAYRPMATILEASKLAGKSTGIVATANIQHATPACFSAHWPNRNDYNELAEQQVYQNIDVVLGGGKQYLLPIAEGGKRVDNDNLIATLKKNGYDYLETPEQLKASHASKIWGMFANDAMAYDLDRDPAKEPSLAEMTQKAIQTLAKNPKGFFLFVEGSKVDWASHANEPIGVISDLLAFDAAVKSAVDFAKTRKDTIVLAFSDHGNGGMSIGSSESNKIYDTLALSAVLTPLKKAKKTGEGLEKKINAEKTNIPEVMAEYYGINDLAPAELELIKTAKPGSLNAVVGPMISKRAYLGWTTTGHTGEDLFLYAYGLNQPVGMIENTAIPELIATRLGLNLNATDKKLFVNLNTFNGLKWNISRELALGTRRFDNNNPVISLNSGKHIAYLPISSNEMIINDQVYHLKGLSYLINGVPYVPQDAIQILTHLK